MDSPEVGSILVATAEAASMLLRETELSREDL
jgi:hypothetical protein